mmetsp:Transcript_1489/g.2259  ORF Transcript_1489/g.2259 Transcript_1489/m.2259 type:complete len:309 (+) Transcript_1489:2613-3539(+)|eukprot:CAMPEP_0184370886 /NCGR_PEP_ID=MMETSP1089-20130417/163085_1 /TAXON_ID=38269 ORGANISM="Gloeochaete wittrockiana, Strain SAG46.84" /NCGR_SAMPLE_ID=MMETSP1089 /ASSEMBLY_ACC=CAM_ASM_000445 /LENGTH=308 /DNA_ID=CAMNT_0026713569 /DNA_START=141 /DNA_END=1067 /DNA_ORIENTATION=-
MESSANEVSAEERRLKKARNGDSEVSEEDHSPGSQMSANMLQQIAQVVTKAFDEQRRSMEESIAKAVVRETLKAIQESKKSTISLSKLSKAEVIKLLEQLGLVYPLCVEDPNILLRDYDDKGSGFQWNKSNENQQKEKYVAEIKASLRSFDEIEVFDNLKVIQLDVPGSKSYAGCTDVMIALKNCRLLPAQGALIGIELKKDSALTDFDMLEQALSQAIGEWITYSVKSHLPYIQILTDLRRGGLAIYLGERAQSSGILMCKVLADMNQLWNFVNDALKELHGKLDGKGFADIDRLENPVRLRYILTK